MTFVESIQTSSANIAPPLEIITNSKVKIMSEMKIYTQEEMLDGTLGVRGTLVREEYEE